MQFELQYKYYRMNCQITSPHIQAVLKHSHAPLHFPIFGLEGCTFIRRFLQVEITDFSSCLERDPSAAGGKDVPVISYLPHGKFTAVLGCVAFEQPTCQKAFKQSKGAKNFASLMRSSVS